jgi:threonine synthase
MELTTRCTGCSTTEPDGAGVCRSCGTVALRPLRELPPAAPGTPLIRSRLGPDLWLKVEGANPTGTFKDRVMARLADEAVAQGSRGAVVASSGNAAVAAAAACLQRGLPLLVVVPATIDDVKLRPLRLRGTAVLRHGQDPSEAYALARFLAERYGLKELASTFHSSGAEYACRQIGHEIAAQLDTAPRAIAAAISVGPVLIGAGNGIVEVGGARPALLAGQAAGCAPIAAAFAAEADEVAPWTAPVTTRAGSIADRLSGYPHEATFALQAIRSSGGSVGAWGDEDLHRFRALLAATDGVDVELASAAAIGAALDWSGPGPVVAVLTGAGWRDTLLGDRPLPAPGTEAFQTATGIDDLHEEIDRWTNSSS